jgi:hypothetical protein
MPVPLSTQAPNWAAPHHVVVPYASCTDAQSMQAMQTLDLPNLDTLLRNLHPQAVQRLSPLAPSLAHERVWAGLHQLDPTAPAWAALQAQQLGLDPHADAAWALITPCNWLVGQVAVTLNDPHELALSPQELDALRLSMAPYFEEDGITLHPHTDGSWLACGEAFRGLRSASPEWALHQDVQPWLPDHDGLRRLQNEMQMLLYTHPVNDARSQASRPTVNSFWISGTGALGAGRPSAHVRLADALVRPALHGNWPAWRAAWHALDAGVLAELLQGLQDTRSGASDVSLTLCSATASLRLASLPKPDWATAARTALLRLLRHPAKSRRACYLESL